MNECGCAERGGGESTPRAARCNGSRRVADSRRFSLFSGNRRNAGQSSLNSFDPLRA